MISACTPTTETQCGDCLAGTASMGGAATVCTQCNVDGKYSVSDNASVCETAKAGYKPTSDHKVRMSKKQTGQLIQQTTDTTCFAHRRERNNALQESTPPEEPTNAQSAAKGKPAARELLVALDVRLVLLDAT